MAKKPSGKGTPFANRSGKPAIKPQAISRKKISGYRPVSGTGKSTNPPDKKTSGTPPKKLNRD